MLYSGKIVHINYILLVEITKESWKLFWRNAGLIANVFRVFQNVTSIIVLYTDGDRRKYQKFHYYSNLFSLSYQFIVVYVRGERKNSLRSYEKSNLFERLNGFDNFMYLENKCLFAPSGSSEFASIIAVLDFFFDTNNLVFLHKYGICTCE